MKPHQIDKSNSDKLIKWMWFMFWLLRKGECMNFSIYGHASPFSLHFISFPLLCQLPLLCSALVPISFSSWLTSPARAHLLRPSPTVSLAAAPSHVGPRLLHRRPQQTPALTPALLWFPCCYPLSSFLCFGWTEPPVGHFIQTDDHHRHAMSPAAPPHTTAQHRCRAVGNPFSSCPVPLCWLLCSCPVSRDTFEPSIRCHCRARMT